MKETIVDSSLKEYVQILSKSDVSKEDLTDSTEYFKGKYFIYFCKFYRKYNVGISSI